MFKSTRQAAYKLALAALLAPSLAPGAPPKPADPLAALTEVPSAQWRLACNALPLTQRMVKHLRRSPLRITVHYTDTKKNLAKPLPEKLCHLFDYSTTKLEEQKRELWGDIPYHFYIAASGHAGEARSLAYQVDSNTDYPRSGHIGIVIEGNPKDGILPAQKKKLFALLAALQKKFAIPLDRIGTHKDHATTDCPGPLITAAVDEYKNQGKNPGKKQKEEEARKRKEEEARKRKEEELRERKKKACERVLCWQSKPPRCHANERLVDLARPEACCSVWRCEPTRSSPWPRPGNSSHVEDEDEGDRIYDEEDEEYEYWRLHAALRPHSF